MSFAILFPFHSPRHRIATVVIRIIIGNFDIVFSSREPIVATSEFVPLAIVRNTIAIFIFHYLYSTRFGPHTLFIRHKRVAFDSKIDTIRVLRIVVYRLVETIHHVSTQCTEAKASTIIWIVPRTFDTELTSSRLIFHDFSTITIFSYISSEDIRRRLACIGQSNGIFNNLRNNVILRTCLSVLNHFVAISAID